jgi:glycosyltransferase involved in cell wall biosynthesis
VKHTSSVKDLEERKRENSSGSTMQPFVSVLTPTYNRRKFIPMAIECFRKQSYPHSRMEWIVLDDGTDKVKDLFAKSGLKNIRYIALPDGDKLKIGAKRNYLNREAKGDICVCMDDDDYYPPDRVKHAVTRLRSVKNQKVPMTGSSRILLYFTDTQEIWEAGPYAPNHCTNGTMAYWHSYSKDHLYDETVDKAEETSFTNKWTTPVLQLVAEETMLVMCHHHNTFDKRALLKKENKHVRKTTYKLKDLVKDKVAREFYIELSKEPAPKEESKEEPKEESTGPKEESTGPKEESTSPKEESTGPGIITIDINYEPRSVTEKKEAV